MMKSLKKFFALMLTMALVLSSVQCVFAEDKAQADLRDKLVDFNTADFPTTFVSKISGSPEIDTTLDRTNSGYSMKLKPGDRVRMHSYNKSGSIKENDSGETKNLNNVKAVEIRYFVRFSKLPNKKNIILTDGFQITGGAKSISIRDDGRVRVGGSTYVGVYLAANVWNEVKYVCDLVNDVICCYVKGKLVNTITDVEFDSISFNDLQMCDASRYDGYVNVDDFSVTESNAYYMTVNSPNTSAVESITDIMKATTINRRGYSFAKTFVAKGSDDGENFYTLSTVGSNLGFAANIGSFPKFVKIFGYDDNKNLVAQSDMIDMSFYDFADRRLVMTKDTWEETDALYYDYGDAYFASCAKLEATSAGSASLSYDFDSPVAVDADSHRYFTARATFRFADKNSDKNILVLKATDSEGNPVEIPYALLTNNANGVASLNISTDKALAANDDLADVTRDWNITAVVDTVSKIVYFFQGSAYHGYAMYNADVASINGIEFSVDATEGDVTSLMYVDNIEIATFDINNQFSVGDGIIYIDNEAADQMKAGNATAKVTVTNNGAAGRITAVAAVYEGNKLVSCTLYPINLSGVINKTYTAEFGDVTADNTVKLFVLDSLDTVKPLKTPVAPGE